MTDHNEQGKCVKIYITYSNELNECSVGMRVCGFVCVHVIGDHLLLKKIWHF